MTGCCRLQHNQCPTHVAAQMHALFLSQLRPEHFSLVSEVIFFSLTDVIKLLQNITHHGTYFEKLKHIQVSLTLQILDLRILTTVKCVNLHLFFI
jgi:hypothetical protein